MKTKKRKRKESPRLTGANNQKTLLMARKPLRKPVNNNSFSNLEFVFESQNNFV